MRKLALLVPLVLTACVAPAPQPDTIPLAYRLISIDGAAFAATATLNLDMLRAFGNGPCNAWSGDIIRPATGGWQIRNVTATEIACPDLAAEQQFFTAMQTMTTMSTDGDVLELLGENGRRMAFVSLTH